MKLLCKPDSARRVGSVCILAALLAAGCAATGNTASTAAADPAAIVMERAQSRWDAATAGDFSKAYEFTAPSYRAVTDFKLYRALRLGEAALISAKVLSSQCVSDESCVARVRIEFNNPTARAREDRMTTHFDERWIKEGDQWWIYLN